MNDEKPVAMPLARLRRPFLWLSLAVLVVGLGLGTAVALEQVNTKPGDQPKSNIRPVETVVLQAEAVPLRQPTLPSGTAAPLPPSSGTDPRMREESIVWEPYRDANTGETGFRPMRKTRLMPVPPPHGVRIRASGENPEIAKQVSSIKAMSEDDETREQAITKLHELLDQEFVKRHDRQADEIFKVEERLEKLTREHGKRGENKDKIVQRRIDSLLDQPDELAWIPSQPTDATRNAPKTFDRYNNRAINGPGSYRQRAPSQVAVLPSIANKAPRTNAAPKTVERFNTTRTPYPPAGSQLRFEPTRPALNRNHTKSTPTQSTQSRGLGRSGFQLDPNRIGPGTIPNLNELFQLARDAERARLAIKLTETNLDALRAKNRAGELVPVQEMAMQKITLERYRRDAELFRKQIDAMRYQLDTQLQYVREVLENALRRSKNHEIRFEQGVATEEPLLAAKLQVLEAKKRVNDTKQLLDHFLDAISDVVGDSIDGEEVEVEFEPREEFETIEEETEGGEEEIPQPTPER